MAKFSMEDARRRAAGADDTPSPDTSAEQSAATTSSDQRGRASVIVVYGLLFLSLLLIGLSDLWLSAYLPALIAVIMAYMARRRANRNWGGHHALQIRTFWVLVWALLLLDYMPFVLLQRSFAADPAILLDLLDPASDSVSLLSIPAVWLAASMLVFMWAIVRCIKGLVLALDNAPLPKPSTWLW